MSEEPKPEYLIPPDWRKRADLLPALRALVAAAKRVAAERPADGEETP